MVMPKMVRKVPITKYMQEKAYGSEQEPYMPYVEKTLTVNKDRRVMPWCKEVKLKDIANDIRRRLI